MAAAAMSIALSATAADGWSARDTRAAGMFDKYCASCHNYDDWAGGFAVEDLDLARIGEHAELGEKVIAKLRAGVMPPHGESRPSRQELIDFARILEDKLDHAATVDPPLVAPPGAHRLNRQEYANAIRDLLSLEIDPAGMLPVDDSSYGFDNMAGSLGSSPALVAAYVSAASKISRLALGHITEPKISNYMAPPDYSQERHIEGAPFGTRGGLLVRHLFPADGEYVFDWTPVRTNAGGMFGNTGGEKLELRIDGQLVKVYEIDELVPQNAQVDRYEARVRMRAGVHTVSLGFIALSDVPNDDLNEHFERTTLTQNLDGYSFSPHVNSMSISGPYNGNRPKSSISRDRVLVCAPAAASEEEACARRIFDNLASKAYRRPASAGDLQTLLGLYRGERQSGGDFESGVQIGVQMILADPSFIYRTEPAPGALAAGKTWAISDVEMASRLSFFLWSTIPDQKLLEVAHAGKLREPRVLEQQVRRMLADPRSQSFVKNFVGQWLQLRNLNSSAPVADIFPDFDDNLRQDFKTEVEMLFTSILQEERDVRELLDANYTFLNERLARHYGIPGVYGSHFRRVTLPPEFDLRRGLLGKGAILTVTSNADRTSTIRRGQWVDINILGVRPPEPPPGTPGLAAQEEKPGQRKLQTLRQRMTEHASNPSCAACHQMMDPIGFAMEGFDGIGKVRTADAGQALDLSGWLVDGTKFEGVTGLRHALLAYGDVFVQTMTSRLLTYALGRGVDYHDMPVVRGIQREASKSDNSVFALIMAVVRSEPFQNNRVVSQSTDTNAAGATIAAVDLKSR